jgi:hypothetical protein
MFLRHSASVLQLYLLCSLILKQTDSRVHCYLDSGYWTGAICFEVPFWKVILFTILLRNPNLRSTCLLSLVHPPPPHLLPRTQHPHLQRSELPPLCPGYSSTQFERSLSREWTQSLSGTFLDVSAVAATTPRCWTVYNKYMIHHWISSVSPPPPHPCFIVRTLCQCLVCLMLTIVIFPGV